MDSNLVKLKYYFRVWLKMSKNTFLVVLARKKLLVMFLTGKTLRIGFFAAFLFFVVSGSNNLVGFGVNETMFFFLTFTLIDQIVQFLYRNVYHFRGKIVSGEFDLTLTKPINPLFNVLLGGADIMDLITIPPLVYVVYRIGALIGPLPMDAAMYVLLLVNAVMISTAFHILVLGLGIVTLEVDHTVMIYRDITSLGRLPVDIYKEPLRGILTYLIPIGVMVTVPAKALMGFISPLGVFASFAMGGGLLFLSFRFWSFALTKYTSASS